MTVEEAIELLEQHVIRGLFTVHGNDSWAYDFVLNVSNYTRTGRPLSTEQSKIILNLVHRARSFLVDNGVDAAEIDALIRNPTHRQTPYPSANVPREVRFLGGNLLGFRFKRNDIIKRDIEGLGHGRPRFQTIWFHREYRLTVVPVTGENLFEAMDVIRDHRFDFDDSVAEFLTCCENNRGRASAFVADRGLGITAAQVYDSELMAWWVGDVLGGTPV
jgi:hypothetical protein